MPGRHGSVIARGHTQEDGEAIVGQRIADMATKPEGEASRPRLMRHLQLERGLGPVENLEWRDPGIAMGGRRLLANGPGERIADAGEAEARSEQRPGIGHQRKAGEAVDNGFGQDRFRRRPQDVAPGMAEGYDPRPEAGCHRQGIGTVLAA